VHCDLFPIYPYFLTKPVSKHSRAARRNEIDESNPKDLKNLPRVEKTDVTSAIIRATVKKNEDLLRNKQEKKEQSRITKVKKKVPTTNLNKDKMEKALNLNDKLEIKILKSKQKAKMVQTARKANWDMINTLARKELDVETEGETDGQVQDEDAMEEEKIYTDDEEDHRPQHKHTNGFALLEEVEA
jgi:hypothetical protein